MDLWNFSNFFSKSAVLFFELKKQPRSVNFHKVMYFSFWNKVSRKLEKLSLRKKTMYSIIGICFEKIDRFLISARCRNFFQRSNKQQKTLQHLITTDNWHLSVNKTLFQTLAIFHRWKGQYIAKNENEIEVKKEKGTQKFK